MVAVAFLTGFCDDAGGFDSDKSFVSKFKDVLLYCVRTHANCLPNCFVAGIALISFAVLAVEQVRIDSDFSRTQIETEDLIWQRKILFICLSHVQLPLVLRSTQVTNFSFGTTIRLPIFSTGKSFSCINS